MNKYLQEYLESAESGQILTLPFIPLRGVVLLPNMGISVDVMRPASKDAVEFAMNNGMWIACIAQKDIENDFPELEEDLYEIGVLAKIVQVVEVNDIGVLRITLEGVRRLSLLSIENTEPYLAEVGILSAGEILSEDKIMLMANLRVLQNHYRNFTIESNRQNSESVSAFLKEEDQNILLNKIASHILHDLSERQHFLTLETMDSKIDYLINKLSLEIQLHRLEKEIEAKVRTTIDKNQREFFLREQLKVLTEELGDSHSNQSAAEAYLEKLKETNIPVESKEKLEKEIHKLEIYPPQNPETSVLRNYLDTVFDLSWGEVASLDYSMSQIQKQLNHDHYALEDVKERILEFIAVQKLRQDRGETNTKGPILCLVGPPGVGKTSIASSIAKAMGRSFVRMSFGGVRDEAEIRGHRRTYIGAMPGRIISAMIQAKYDNPLILMDEIDKMSADYKGDPSSALLEVLDPEQNKDFRDHYLEIPYDLSQVLFVTTANQQDLIPPALRDRMEVIVVNGYTVPEKYEIAKRHLLPKQIRENALEEDELTIYKPAMLDLISNYTAEAGVRQLERVLAKVCRRVALEIAESKDKGEEMDKVKVTSKNLEQYAGRAKYSYDSIGKKALVGLVRGLAWTSAGGDTLEIEASVMPGKGKLSITGQLGDVMQESCQVALAYVKSKSKKYNISKDFFETHDLHVHVPAGAVPKDGPSAGITLAMAIFSAVTKQEVRPEFAMTGELTLRGRVMAIGGLKEKLIAADRAGIKQVVLPQANERDLEDIPREILDKLTLHLVEDADEILEILFG